MSDSLPARTHPEGQTTGTSERPAQHLTGPVLVFDLESSLAQLHREEAWRRGDRNAMTLAKGPDLRIVLVAMKEGARLPAHQTSARLAIQTLSGSLRLQLADHAVDLPQGNLLTLDPELEHSIEARAQSAFLLTIAWQGHTPVAPSPLETGP